MKPHIHKIVGILVALTALMAGGAKAQNATRAHVPFNFSVNNTTIAAGDCVITRINSSQIRVSSTAKNGGQVFALATSGDSRRNVDKGKWIFHRYGESYFLAGMSMPDYGLTVPKSKTEKNLRKELGLASMSKDHPSPTIPEVLAINVTN